MPWRLKLSFSYISKYIFLPGRTMCSSVYSRSCGAYNFGVNWSIQQNKNSYFQLKDYLLPEIPPTKVQRYWDLTSNQQTSLKCFTLIFALQNSSIVLLIGELESLLLTCSACFFWLVDHLHQLSTLLCLQQITLHPWTIQRHPLAT